jgi:hypothetical protein
MAAMCSPVRLEPQPKRSCLVDFFHVSYKSSRRDYFPFEASSLSSSS